MLLDAEKPFNHLLDLPPLADIETKAIVKECILARRSVAALNQAGGVAAK